MKNRSVVVGFAIALARGLGKGVVRCFATTDSGAAVGGVEGSATWSLVGDVKISVGEEGALCLCGCDEEDLEEGERCHFSL